MSDFLELCELRQSCRKFADKSVEHEKLVKCVEAARLAPSACNSEPWSFVVVETPEIVSKVAKTGQPNGMNQYLSGAKAFIIVLEEHAVLMQPLRGMLDSQYFAKGDLGAATEHICLEAESLGLGSLIVGVYDRPALRELFDIPAEKQFGALIAIGYSEDAPRKKQRKSLDEIVKYY
ncbi:NAD(P)H nitroreductase [Clostridia bacterium]|nr:NAD(P)H nitroreductase [Clostridia bacterium]